MLSPTVLNRYGNAQCSSSSLSSSAPGTVSQFHWPLRLMPSTATGRMRCNIPAQVICAARSVAHAAVRWRYRGNHHIFRDASSYTLAVNTSCSGHRLRPSPSPPRRWRLPFVKTRITPCAALAGFGVIFTAHASSRNMLPPAVPQNMFASTSAGDQEPLQPSPARLQWP